MEELPPEIVVHILSFLGVKEVTLFCSLGRWTRNLAKEQRKLLTRRAECDGDIVAKKLGGLYVPNNEPLEKDKEDMKAKFFVDPLGLVQGKLEFSGEYGSSCWWTVKNGKLHGPFSCRMETPFDETLVEEGSFQRGRLHGVVHSFVEQTPKYGTWTTWFKGEKKRVHIVDNVKVSVKERRSFRTRKSRERYTVSQKKVFYRQRYSRGICSGKTVRSWDYWETFKRGKELVSSLRTSWFEGTSHWRLEHGDGTVSVGSDKGGSCFIGRCCEKHRKDLEEVTKGICAIDYDIFF
nr:hypothetical protein [Marseillevirus cajuinensis]